MIKIKIPFRLHINLLAMHSCTYRKNGGIGLSIISDEIFLTSKKSSVNIIKITNYCSHEEKINQIINLLDKIKINYNLNSSVYIELHGRYFIHSGLGIGTAITLACIEALFLTNDITLPEQELVILSERGGTSGIGINTYFSGGFIIDSGIKADNSPHVPSSKTTPSSYSKILARCNFPDWKLGVLIPKKRDEVYNCKELTFFEKNCPIPKEEAYYASYLAIMGTFASVLDKDYELFCKSINDTANTYWKSKEISETPSNIELIKKMITLNADSAGMSSFGNSIYFFYRKKNDILDFVEKNNNYILMDFRACNSGRVIC